MSRIFDALQRSEAERSGTGDSPVPDATELLRHAERRAVSEWEVASPPEPEVRPERSVARNGRAPVSNGVAAPVSNGRTRIMAALLTLSDAIAAIMLAADLLVVCGSVLLRFLFNAPVES